MWNEAIGIVLGGIVLYLITTLLIGWLQSRRKKENKVIPLTKDFWDEEIDKISKANPAYRDSSTKKFADKRKEEYVKKNPTKPVSYKKGVKQSRTYGSRSNNKPVDNIAVVPSSYEEAVNSEEGRYDDSSSSSPHSTVGFGAGGAFGGAGAAGYWGGDSHSSSNHSSSSHSDYSSHDSSSSYSSSDSGSSDSGGCDGGGGGD